MIRSTCLFIIWVFLTVWEQEWAFRTEVLHPPPTMGAGREEQGQQAAHRSALSQPALVAL